VRIHRNAKLTPGGRAAMIERLKEGWSVGMVGAAFHQSDTTVRKWWGRYRAEGNPGLQDRSSRPNRFRRPVAHGRIVQIIALRRKRLTGWQIAQILRMPRSTVAAVLRRVGLSRLALLEPPKPPAVRYERERAGELVHLDVKPLAKIGVVGHRIHGDRRCGAPGVGYEFVHVAIDDASRLAYGEVLADQRGSTAVDFFERARRFFTAHGIRRIERVMTDNGSCYVSRRFRRTLDRHQMRHLRTRPYRPQTNGKAERFIQTMLLGWAYKRPYPNSKRRTAALAPWLRYYNEQRPHRSLGMNAPLKRLRLAA
jgi:transposase InsO family protein